MDERNIDREIDLRGLLARSLSKWKTILLIAVILAVLMTGFSVLKQKKDYADQKKAAEEMADIDIDSEKAAALKEAGENNIATLKEIMYAKQIYYSESLLSRINPTKVCTAKADIFTDAKEENAEERQAHGAEAAHLVFNYINNDIDLEPLAAELETTPVFLREVIRTSVDNSAGFTGIEVISDQTETAERILGYILDHVGERLESLTNETMSFDVVRHETETLNDTSLTSWHYSRLKEISDIDSLLSKVEAIDTDADSASVPAEFKISTKKLIKFGGIGFIGGILLGLFTLMLIYAMDDSILSADELSSALHTKKLGRISGGRKISPAIRKIAGDPALRRADDLNTGLLTAKLGNLMKSERKIALVGDVSQEKADAAAQLLNTAMADKGFSFEPVGRIDRDAETAGKLEKCDAVILLSEIWSSKYKDTLELKSITEDMGLKTAGSVTM